MSECDVLVVGAGPVGAFAALLLLERGLKVTIIERESGIVQSPRALVYHAQVLAVLEEAGVLEDVQKEGRQAKGGIVWRKISDHTPLSITDGSALQPEDTPKEHLRVPVLLGQHKFNEIVLDRFREKGGQVLFDHAFESLDQRDGHVKVTTVDSEGTSKTFTASFVIGADGGKSSIRKSIDAHLDGFTHDVHMMAINLRYSEMLSTGFSDAQFLVDPQARAEDTAFAVIIHTGTDDIWRCAYVDSDRFSDDELKARVPMKLKMILPHHPDESEYEVLMAQPYRIHQRCASHYAKGRVLLMGDAAHLNNPVGGFGMNTGLLDAPVAAIAIADAMKMTDEAAIDKRLGQYSDVRRKAFLEFTNPVTTENLRRGIEASDEAEEKLRNSFFESMKDPAFQRNMLLGVNKMALGVPGF